MTDVPAPPQGRSGGLDGMRLVFWLAMAAGLAAAGVTVALGPSVGRGGTILLIALGAAGMVFVAWLMRGAGRAVGLFPERGAAEAATLFPARGELALLEAIEEPALLAEKSGAPIAANTAYMTLARRGQAMGESERPPVLDRVFGGDPVLSPALFRLSRAAAGRQSRRETLPPTRVGDGELVRYEASVSPAPGGRVLWRLREVVSADGASDLEARNLFVEDAPIGFFSVRTDGVVVYMNRALRAVLGYGEEGGQVKLKDILKDDPARVLRRDRKSSETQRNAITLRARDGVEIGAHAMSVWPGGTADGASRTFVFFGDAATLDAGEDAAPAAPREAVSSGSFFDNAPFGAAHLDGADLATAAVLDANAALMEMAQGRAAPGVTFADIFDASEGPAALAQKLRQASREPVEVQLATQPPKAAHVYLARADDGRGLAYVINVTEQRELEQRLSQAEKMREIGMLAGGVAHDFNNLLMAMMQNCDYLLRRHPVGDPDYLDLAEINHHALRAKELSERLRAYARQQTFRREPVDVSGFIAQLHELIRRLVGETVKFEVRHGRDVPFIKADKAQLERVLINLATNARDAMASGERSGREQRLTIRTARVTAAEARAFGHNPIEDGEYVLIEVIDTGGGIRPEDQPKLFRPFFSTKEAGHGTGLGLATSYGIIKQSEGYIFFDSKLGVGTTFRIFLPVYEPSAEERAEIAQREREAANRGPVDVSGRGRILLVEDEDGLRRSIARNLNECGYDVVEAEDGEEGLARLTAAPGGYDLIISDVTMPIMTGPEMLQAATAEMMGKAKVLFLSGYAPESFGAMLERYPVHYVAKPVGLQPLAQKVKEILAA